jgi:phosphate uptake regulator
VTFLERLGDYAKNLRELSQALDRPFAEVPHADRLRALTGEVLGMFDLTRRALATEEVQEARAVLAKNRAISAEARRLIESFLREPQGDSRPAVLAVLFARYLKRISGHLMNAASSVINAFDQIGFYPEKDRIADDE